MASGDFYVVLPSNTITDIYPNNRTSDYEIPLPRALEFPTTYEVALVEIHFPHTWENIRPPFLALEFGTVKSYTARGPEMVLHRTKLEHGFYDRVEDLVHAIDSIKPSGFRGKIFTSKESKTVKVQLFPWEFIKFHRDMATLLGLAQDEFVNNDPTRKRTFKAPYIADIHAAMHNIYIYSSIVKETLVGNDWHPLLRIVPSEGEHGRNIHMSFQKPYYLEVALDRISSIRIILCDDQATPVRFTFGKVICKLHFRRKKLHLV